MQTGLEIPPQPVALVTRLARLSGIHLVDRLLAQHHRVVGTKARSAPGGNLDAVFERIEPRPAAIRDPGPIRQNLTNVRPVRICQPAVLSMSKSGGKRRAWYKVDIKSTNFVRRE